VGVILQEATVISLVLFARIPEHQELHTYVTEQIKSNI